MEMFFQKGENPLPKRGRLRFFVILNALLRNKRNPAYFFAVKQIDRRPDSVSFLHRRIEKRRTFDFARYALPLLFRQRCFSRG